MTKAEYHAYLQSPEWKWRAEEAKLAANNQCALCTSSTNLNVHHRTYDRVGYERLSDLIVLCRVCHRRHHRVLQPAAIRRRDALRAYAHGELDREDLDERDLDPRRDGDLGSFPFGANTRSW